MQENNCKMPQQNRGKGIVGNHRDALILLIGRAWGVSVYFQFLVH